MQAQYTKIFRCYQDNTDTRKFYYGLNPVLKYIKQLNLPLHKHTSNNIGYFPRYMTDNCMNHYWSKYNDMKKDLFKNATIGFTSLITSDSISNFDRVIKKNNIPIYYKKSIRNIIKSDGFKGLFFRGISTRLFTHGLQGILFNFIWKYFNKQ